ncbi:MAG: M48 family metalloprotease [Deltaproteobacteria bacterium]|nr:M48 family metalloprotease [Deltaproteobacteria bacterium]
MDAVELAKASIPIWVRYGPFLVLPSLSFLIGILLPWFATKFVGRTRTGTRALADEVMLVEETDPKSRDHWTHQASARWGQRTITRQLALLIPLLLMSGAAAPLGTMLVAVPTNVLVAMIGAAGYVGSLLFRWRLMQAIVPGTKFFAGWLREGIGFLFNAPTVPVAVLFYFLYTSSGFGWRWCAVFALNTAVTAVALRGGAMRLARACRLAAKAPADIQHAVSKVAQRANRPPPEVFVVAFPGVNALASPFSDAIAFSERAVETLSVDELAAIAAHEIGHLSEPGWAVALRWTQALIGGSLGALRPLFDLIGLKGTAIAYLVVFALLVSLRRVTHRLETRADEAAVAQSDGAEYARALEHIYRANMVPPVLAGQFLTHPNLYDRLLASGMTPDYLRPAGPKMGRVRIALVASVVSLIAIFPLLNAATTHPPAWLISSEVTRAQVAVAVFGARAWHLGRLGGVLEDAGQLEPAVNLFRAAKALAPDAIYYQARFSVGLAKSGACDQARIALDQMKETPPRDNRDAQNSAWATQQIADYCP